MANELRLNMAVTHLKEPASNWSPFGAIQATQTGAGVFQQTLEIGTTAETVSFGDVTPGLVILYNLDDTNFVTYGLSDGGTIKDAFQLYPMTRWPGMHYMKPGATLMMQADTAACEVHVVAYEL